MRAIFRKRASEGTNARSPRLGTLSKFPTYISVTPSLRASSFLDMPVFSLNILSSSCNNGFLLFPNPVQEHHYIICFSMSIGNFNIVR